ncbi:MAG: sulfurtransferase TusA family protein [Geminicoccaceae bacterium]
MDARGLSCPIPLLKARQALMLIASGERITVIATDPAAPADFEAFCEESGHELIETAEAAGLYCITVQKKV